MKLCLKIERCRCILGVLLLRLDDIYGTCWMLASPEPVLFVGDFELVQFTVTESGRL
jgi:hypothetical protein